MTDFTSVYASGSGFASADIRFRSRSVSGLAPKGVLERTFPVTQQTRT